MTIPQSFKGDISNIHYYQGVIIAEIAVMLILYILLRIIHYVKWGYLQDEEAEDGAKKKQVQQQQSNKRWDQKVWDVYFPIIYANHLICLSLTLCYIPYIFQAIIAYMHFVCFLGLLVVNIFIKDAEPGNGNRTKATRVFWLLMCLLNLTQIIAGLTGVAKVLTSA